MKLITASLGGLASSQDFLAHRPTVLLISHVRPGSSAWAPVPQVRPMSRGDEPFHHRLYLLARHPAGGAPEGNSSARSPRAGIPSLALYSPHCSLNRRVPWRSGNAFLSDISAGSFSSSDRLVEGAEAELHNWASIWLWWPLGKISQSRNVAPSVYSHRKESSSFLGGVCLFLIFKILLYASVK